MVPSWQKNCPNCGSGLLGGKFKLYRRSEFGRARRANCCSECGRLITYRIGWAFVLATLAAILSFAIKVSEVIPYPDGIWWVAFTVTLMIAVLFFFTKPALSDEPEE